MKNLFLKTSMIVMLLSMTIQFTNAQCIKTYTNETMMGNIMNQYILAPIKEAVPMADETTKGIKVYKGIAFMYMKSGASKYLLLNLMLNKDMMLADKKLSENDAITLNFEGGSTFEYKPNQLVGYFGIDDLSRTAIGGVKVTDELKSLLQKSLLTSIIVGDQTFAIKKGKSKKLIKSTCYLD